MEEKVNFALVGVFVLVLSAALIGGVLWLSSGKSYRTSYDIYQTYMNESVAGLNLNAPVLYRGVEVGRVRKIALAPGNVEQVQLTLAIERGTPVKVDTVAVLKTQGLTGLAFVELTGGGRDSAALKKQPGEDYPVIKAGPSLITRLDSAVTSLLTNLNKASENANALLDAGNRREVTSLLSNLNKTSENANALLDADNRRAIKKTLADLEIVSNTLATSSALIDSSLADAAHTMKNTARLTDELTQLTQRVQRSADAFDRMSGQLGHAGASASMLLDSTRQFTSEGLPEIQQLVTQLRDLSGSLQRISSQLEQNPSVLLYGKPAAKRGPGE